MHKTKERVMSIIFNRFLSYYLCSVLPWTTRKRYKTLVRPLHTELNKIKGIFKDFHRNLQTFQGKKEFEDFSRL